MANSDCAHAAKFIFLLITLSLLLLLLQCSHASVSPSAKCFSSIIGFGNSLSDTGNLNVIVKRSNSTSVVPGRLPYGITYFHRDSGRASDGRLIIDFIAQTFGLPFVAPYLAGPDGHGFKKGVNFAVSGATALNASFFTQRGLRYFGPTSLGDEVNWFKQLLPSLCFSSSKDCEHLLGNSLIVVGEIGGNDYNTALAQNVDPLNITRTYIPKVIKAISNTIKLLVKLGAKTMVVPGVTPVGCSSLYLTLLQNQTKDATGCIKFVNDLFDEHDRQLVAELDHLRKLHHHATIIYADFYSAVYNIIKDPRKYGFDKALGACCGTGGLYNVNPDPQRLCGTAGTKVCRDPSKYVDWDGAHYTEAVYKIVADGFLRGPYAFPITILEACEKLKHYHSPPN